MSGIEVREAAWDDPAGEALRRAMEAEMELRYADRLAEFAARAEELQITLGVQAEKVVYVGVAYDEHGLPVGHAALRDAGPDVELKRMYVAPSHRGKGVSTALLAGAEEAARALGAARIILQTGDRQPDAVRLYEREGYTRVPVFAPYEWLTFSICMEKPL
ncbi:GNAT family N-acetyltransferase [Actinocorallia longicatena]|uniref:GNAT family N-acetyltransferase n=1 Tax=Actinocorallia longicatena TaxID=111803 RepID=A0ABP6QI71_9ACTN